MIDVYHAFWDPRLEDEIARAAGRIVGFHVNDWLAATRHTLLERGMMGDGIIDLRRLRGLVDAAGYDGPIEVEILNPAIWDLPRAELMGTSSSGSSVRALARRRRAARREPVREDDVAPVALAEHGVCGAAAHLVQRHADRRQPDEARRARVVDARDRDLPGTSTPASRRRISTPIATSSLAPTTASGSPSRASSSPRRRRRPRRRSRPGCGRRRPRA